MKNALIASFLLLSCVLDTINSYARYHLAAAYANLGRPEAALTQLKLALENGYDDFEEMEQDARWEGLRGTEVFEGLLGAYRRE